MDPIQDMVLLNQNLLILADEEYLLCHILLHKCYLVSDRYTHNQWNEIIKVMSLAKFQ